MQILRIVSATLLLSLATACSNGNGNNFEFDSRPPLNLAFSELPAELSDTGADYAQDVPYGEGERNLFDIYLPDCDDPTGLVIFIHGGGFTNGNKSNGNDPDLIRELLQSCVAYATISYFLLDVPSAAEGTDSIAGQGGVLTSLRDTARALQFMRYHFASLNLDPERVAAFGVSAGAGASLWLGTHDDMADPDSGDPVLRESTRLKAVGAIATQSTYDLLRWEDILLPLTERFAEVLGGTDIPTVAAAVGATNYLLTFLGVPQVADIYSAENADYRANVDMLGLMDAGDAPIFVHNFETPFADLLNVFLHHGLHALAVKARADEVGLHNVAYSDDPEFNFQDPSAEELSSFLLRHVR
jgi:para-nitrobenzyl esterase